MLASRHDEFSGMMSPAASSCEARLAWLIMHPFGLPVVPEVKKIAASSSAGRVHSDWPPLSTAVGRDVGAADVRAAQRLGGGAFSWVSCPGGEVPFVPGSHHCTVSSSGAHGGGSAPSTTIKRGSTRSTIRAAASWFISRSNGTTIAPSFQIANR
jgi:hypothetical protein